MSLNYVTLTVDVYDAQGNVATAGTAAFTPSATLTDTTNHEIVAPIPIVVSFKAGASPPTVKLLATDNGTLAPSGWGWTVAFTGTGLPSGFNFFLAYGGGASQDLSSLNPVSSVAAMAAYLPIDYPTGAASGYVWTSDSSGNGSWQAASVSGTLAIALGGTGQTSAQTAMDALAGGVTSTQYLRGNGSHVVLSAIQAADLPTGTTSAQGALQLDGTVGDIKPTSTAAAVGAAGKAADASHVHAQNYGGIFGNGSDGAVTFDGSTTILGMVPSSQIYTMTRDIQCTGITINNGVTLKPSNFRIFCQGTLTNNGTISAAGAAASAGTGGSSGGSAALTGGRAGGNGGTGVSGTGANGTTANYGAAGGAGGAGTAGAAGSGGTITISAAIAQSNILITPYPLILNAAAYLNTVTGLGFGAGGGGGGSDAASNAGGGGGAGGGIVAIFAWAVVNTGTITAAGGNGANGTAGNAGAGGGGAGGLVAAYTLSAWTVGTVTVTGGTKGTKSGTGSDGSNGGAGVALNVVVA